MIIRSNEKAGAVMRKYYEAYDDRYRQVHRENLHWFDENPSAIVLETMEKFSVARQRRILEVGCGEGRDARFLLGKGCNVLATDVSPAAVDYCREQDPAHKDAYACLDCLNCGTTEQFDFIYAVAVVHMLVPQHDRDNFYRFFREHLTDTGIGLICSMGDGSEEVQSDISNAFDIRDRLHEASGKVLHIANTSCRVVSFEKFSQEIRDNGLAILETGHTSVKPDFPEMIYAIVAKK